MPIYSSIDEMVGRTPLVRLARLERKYGLACRLLAKVEAANPAGSVKDRVARTMLDRAEAEGRLVAGATVVEPTSGNTGIGLAALCAARGYRAVIVMPEGMSAERAQVMRALGAEVVLTPRAEGMAGAIRRAEALVREIEGAFMPSQFENPANPAAHYATTAPELWEDTEGALDIFVAGVGTGGTVSGTGRYLKEKNPAVSVVAVEPAASPVLSGGATGPHPLQGIGAGFVPSTLDRGVIDEVIAIDGEAAFAAARELAAAEGLLCGISSGAALAAALRVAARPENAGKTLAVLLPDGGDRYLSTPLYDLT